MPITTPGLSVVPPGMRPFAWHLTRLDVRRPQRSFPLLLWRRGSGRGGRCARHCHPDGLKEDPAGRDLWAVIEKNSRGLLSPTLPPKEERGKQPRIVREVLIWAHLDTTDQDGRLCQSESRIHPAATVWLASLPDSSGIPVVVLPGCASGGGDRRRAGCWCLRIPSSNSWIRFVKQRVFSELCTVRRALWKCCVPWLYSLRRR